MWSEKLAEIANNYCQTSGTSHGIINSELHHSQDRLKRLSPSL